MGILTDAAPVILICTRDVPRTAAFYREVLGLTPVSEDKYAAVFTIGGVMLRVSLVPDFVVNGHTVVGFQVQDLAGAIQALREKGVVPYRPEGLCWMRWEYGRYGVGWDRWPGSLIRKATCSA